MSIETREARDTVEGLELRAAPEGSKSPGTLVGYSAKYERYSCDLGYFREKLAPGCFDKALTRCDVRALYNHDPNLLLGRMSAGTLRLVSDGTGLHMECDLPDTALGRDVAENTRLRNLQGQSFSFTTSVQQWDQGSDPAIRTVIDVEELFDVGPVTFPAYEDTDVAMRSFRSLPESAKEKPPEAPPATPAHVLESERDKDRLAILAAS